MPAKCRFRILQYLLMHAESPKEIVFQPLAYSGVVAGRANHLESPPWFLLQVPVKKLICHSHWAGAWYSCAKTAQAVLAIRNSSSWIG